MKNEGGDRSQRAQESPEGGRNFSPRVVNPGSIGRKKHDAQGSTRKTLRMRKEGREKGRGG